MTVSKFDTDPKDFNGDAVLYMLSEEQVKEKNYPCDAHADIIREASSRKDFTGEKASLFRIPLFSGTVKNLYLAGLGSENDLSSKIARETLSAALRSIGKQHNSSVLLLHNADKALDARVTACAAELSSYSFNKYKTKKENKDAKFSLKTVFTVQADAKQSKYGKIAAEAQMYARDLANEPGNVINPPSFAKEAKRLAASVKIHCEVWDEKRIKKERMGALLAVGQGSQTPPRFIHFSYKPKSPKKKIVFVGKGITFDAGGLDLKPADGMLGMKSDKAGACAVFGIMRAVAELQPKLEVHGLVAAAENMPSGAAFRPNDIITARNGRSIEVNNTDAEGRLVLADALCIASELKPDIIIDIATLTGACVVALGKWQAGLFARDKTLCADLIAASHASGEPMWPMPDYDEKIAEGGKSTCADTLNTAGRFGGLFSQRRFLRTLLTRAFRGRISI